MSQRRKKKPGNKSGPRASSKSGDTKRPAHRSFRVPAWLIILTSLILIASGAYWWVNRPIQVALPEVPLTGLESNVVALIEGQLQGVEEKPYSAAAWGRLGSVLKAFDFKSQALLCLAEAERLDPKEPRWPYLQAFLQTDLSTSFTLAKLSRTVELCGHDPAMPGLRLAKVLAEMGQMEEAGKALQPLLRTQPESGPVNLLLAQIHQSKGNWNTAITRAQVSAKNPYTARSAWTLLAAIHRRLGDETEADRASRRAMEVTPDATWPDPYEEEVQAWRTDARSLSDRAQSYILANNVKQALPLVTQLVQQYPDFSESWLLLGRIQFMQKNPQAAEQSLRKFLEMDATSVNGQFQLGMCLMAQSRYQEAVTVFRHATTLKKDFGPAYFNLGFALAKSGQKREAIVPFQEAIRQNPEKIDSYILLSDLHWQLGEKTQASQLAGLAQTLNPDDPRLPVLIQKIQSLEFPPND